MVGDPVWDTSYGLSSTESLLTVKVTITFDKLPKNSHNIKDLSKLNVTASEKKIEGWTALTTDKKITFSKDFSRDSKIIGSKFTLNGVNLTYGASENEQSEVSIVYDGINSLHEIPEPRGCESTNHPEGAQKKEASKKIYVHGNTTKDFVCADGLELIGGGDLVLTCADGNLLYPKDKKCVGAPCLSYETETRKCPNKSSLERNSYCQGQRCTDNDKEICCIRTCSTLPTMPDDVDIDSFKKLITGEKKQGTTKTVICKELSERSYSFECKASGDWTAVKENACLNNTDSGTVETGQDCLAAGIANAKESEKCETGKVCNRKDDETIACINTDQKEACKCVAVADGGSASSLSALVNLAFLLWI